MAIQELRNAGLSKSATARELGIDRGTVSKYWDYVESDVEPPRYKNRGTNCIRQNGRARIGNQNVIVV